MNGRSAGPPPLSSPNDSEWSGYSHYNNASARPQSPGFPPQSRGNIMTPPMSGSSNGTQPRMSSGMPGRPNGPSPPNSITGRSSYMSSSDARRRQTMQMEDRLAQHYAILRRFLGQSLRDEKGNLKPNRARDKLLRLSGVQFQELSTDVYDELLRRQSSQGQQMNGPGQVPPYLLARDNFHPKRNQARQKLATLPAARFRDLATDVFYELERRFPHFAGRDIPRNGSPLGPPSRVGTPNSMKYGARNQSMSGQPMGGMGMPGGSEDPYGRPTAKQFQSNTIIPNKSTMVEEDDDDALSDVYNNRRDTTFTARSVGVPDRKAATELEAQVTELQGKVKGLEAELAEKDSALQRMGDEQSNAANEREKFSELQSELEAKLRSARDFNQTLQAELDKVRQDQMSTERELRSQIEDMSNEAQGGNEWRDRYESLDRSYQELESEVSRREQITNEVKEEFAGFLIQMKALSDRSSEAFEREDKLHAQVQRLQGEIAEWQERYARARSRAAGAFASKSLQSPGLGDSIQTGGFISSDGSIKALHISRLHIAIDDLLHTARSQEPREALQQVKSIAACVRDISLDVKSSHGGNNEQGEQYKRRVASAMNNLITATRTFAVSQGLSPVSLLDAAASHLSTSVIELASIVKVQPNPDANAEDDGNSDIVDSPADYYGLINGRASTGNESIDSTYGKPQLASRAFSGSKQRKPVPNGISNGVQPRQAQPFDGIQDGRIAELKNFLDSRTDTLRSTLQNLVSSIRASAPPHDILDAVASITSTTSQIVHQTSQLVPPGSKPSMMAERLASLVGRMEDKGREGETITTDTAWKEYVNEIPPIGFEIARGVKELGTWVESEVNGGDFS